MNKLLISIIFLSWTSIALSQNRTDSLKVDLVPFVYPIQIPYFPGGDTEMYKYIANSLQYPLDAKEMGIEGKVEVGFSTDKTGRVINVRILKGLNPSCDREAMRVIGNMPNWIPGKSNGYCPVLNYSLPVIFKLADTGSFTSSH